ncbi:dipeptide ABC transporter ATP-binding protein [Rathayibacter sp. KR2-224]|uniref:dipeptide ABC transporter ATP-binding protein n=1 Tax=Rathayibacter sp. KR2-224 TaxID=3400913 RepID=UPI003C09A5F7
MTQQHHADVLAVNGLSVSFADQNAGASARTVVDDVSFTLRQGRVLALVGESGSGKSVSAMSVLGLLPPTAKATGSIRLQGEELVGADAGTLRRVRGGRIGTIFQEPATAFDPMYRIGWQIGEAIRAHNGRVPRGRLHARVRELLAAVGLPDSRRIARSYPHQLSGGQLQRAMIAMAISCEPVALMADEPTTALDVTVQAGILELIRSLRDTAGTAVLLITHDMGVVADLADDVVVMQAGRVVERADAATLFAHPQAEYTRQLLDAVPRLDRLRIDVRSRDEPAPSGPATERRVDDATDVARDPSPAPAAEGLVVDVRNAVVTYGGGWGHPGLAAVDGVSLGIAAGTTLGLVGESGSGKSTLGRALAGLVPLSSGSIAVTGLELGTASARELRAVRRDVGFVFQDPASSLNPRFTVGQAIAEPLRLHTKQDAAARRTRVADLLDAVDLPRDFASRYPHELSGGQRQRVAIARAVALEPSLLIADEPTSALDVSVQAHILDLLAELRGRLGFACLFISHDLAVVQELADEVAVMRAGRLVESGPTTQVLTAPTQPYTLRLLAAAPVPDPQEQRRRREAWLAVESEDEQASVPAGVGAGTDLNGGAA